MNLYPFSGGATVSKEYKALKKDIIYERAMSCVKAINPKRIVCCLDVYDKVVKCFDVEEIGNGFKFKCNNRKFKKCRVILENKEIDVWEFYHPASRVKKFAKDNICIIGKE